MIKLMPFSFIFLTAFANPIVSIEKIFKLNQVLENKKHQATTIDWDLIEDHVNNFISQIQIENNLKTIFLNETNAIMKRSKNNHFNLNQLVENIRTKHQKFNQYFSANDLTHESKSFSDLHFDHDHNLINYWSYSSNDFNQLEKLVNDLKISRVTFTTISATSAIAAAGFWAAAPFSFGATVPWATACTVITSVSGGVAAGLNIALIKYDQELSQLSKVGKAFTSVYYLGHIFYRTLKPLLIGVSVSIGATSWAFPAALALLPIAGSILAWIELYR